MPYSGVRSRLRYARALCLLILLASVFSPAGFAAGSARPGLLVRVGQAFSSCMDGLAKLSGLSGTLSKKLPYCYHYEICELPGLPEGMRSAVFTALGTTSERFSGIQGVLHDAIGKVLKETGSSTVIELGSGSGNGLAVMADGFPSTGEKGVRFIATDLYPQVESWKGNFKGKPNLLYVDRPISFTDFPEELNGIPVKGATLVVVSAFHHIDNAQARTFLEKAAKAGANVVIVEPLERDVRSALTSLGAVLPALAAPILARNITPAQRLKLALYDWILPVVPFTFIHDGIVSTLRERTKEDWDKLTQGLPFKMRLDTKLGPMKNFTVLTLTPDASSSGGS